MFLGNARIAGNLRTAYSLFAVATNVALVIFVLNTTLILSTRELSSAQKLVTHSRDVQMEICAVAVTMESVQINQRAYLLTGRVAYREQYERSKGRFWRHVDAVGRMTADNPVQRKNVKLLRWLGAEKVRFMDETAAIRERGELPPDTDLDRGDELSRWGESLLVEMDAAESVLLEARQRAVAERVRRVYWGLFAILGKDMVLAGVILWAAARQYLRHHRAARGVYDGDR